MFKKVSGLMVLVGMLVLVLAACNPADVNLPQTGATPDVNDLMTPGAVDIPAAALRAQDQLAQVLNISALEVDILSAEPVEWPDACLGLALSDEMCAQVVTPGWRISLLANGQQYTFHSDQVGDMLRMVPAQQ